MLLLSIARPASNPELQVERCARDLELLHNAPQQCDTFSLLVYFTTPRALPGHENLVDI
jgi:hypothetical protein